MSHHLDTPLAAENGQLFLDDLYVFQGENATVLMMDVNSNVTGVYAEPGFHPEARYEFKIHLDGEAVESLTYRLAFGEPDPAGRQSLRLESLSGADAHEDGADGSVLLQGRTGETATAEDGIRVWAGRISDAFYIDLSLLSVINAAVGEGGKVDLSGWKPGEAKNTFAGTTVETIVLEIPHTHPVLRPGTRIGVWAATKLATDAGGWRQINRAGHPMMWPIFWPTDTDFSNPANTRHPSKDVAEAGSFIAERVSAVVAATGTSADPDAYGQEVARQLLPDVLSYTVGTPAQFGFATRNGRTQADNAPEAMLSLVTNSAVPTGLTQAVAADLRTPRFPYIVEATS
jgi:hypothetical protein